MQGKELLKLAIEAQKNAYAPYSNYHVGAAVLLKDGKVIKGCNVENASYGLSNCAERTALFTCIAQGYKKDDIVAIAIASSSNPPASPCGACRQVMIELIPSNAKVYYGNDKQLFETTIGDLLPASFTKDLL